MADNVNLLCQEKHRNIDSRLDGHDDDIKGIHIDINVLQMSSARADTMITTLCKKIDSLITVLMTGILAIFGVTAGFLIWYVQSLPR